MKVLIEYVDHPEWAEIAEEDTWNEIMTHVGCTASRLTVLEDLPRLGAIQAALNHARRAKK